MISEVDKIRGFQPDLSFMKTVKEASAVCRSFLDGVVIFRMRGRVTELKTNFKGKYESFECDACKIEDETQKHIIECKEINKEKKKIKKYQNLKNYIKEMYKIN